ncbi:MAG TPA: hypothetical protein VGH54_10410 [Mycobacterium sp.]|uniref:hypothetical protein n=1 Tax=Mycobacterium sp. TaxID=1785 RepID=UPI002F419C2D
MPSSHLIERLLDWLWKWALMCVAWCRQPRNDVTGKDSASAVTPFAARYKALTCGARPGNIR